MGIPKQVQDQGKAADKLFEAEPVEGTSVDIEGAEADKTAAGQEGDAGAQVEGKPEKEIKPENQGGTEDFEQKFKALQGLFQDQSDQLRAIIEENQRANLRNESLQEVLETIAKAKGDGDGKSPGQDGAAGSEKLASLTITKLDEAEFDEYDDGVKKLVKRLNDITDIAQNLYTENASLKQNVTDLSSGMEGVRKNTAEVVANSFEAKLHSRVSDWDQVNNDPKFIEWVSKVDGFSGLTRKQIGDAAYGRGDVNTLANLVSGFKQEQETTGANADTTHGAEKGDGDGIAAKGLESQIVPNSGIRVDGDGASKKFTPVSKDDYNAAVKDKIFGKITEEQFLAIEKDFYKTIEAQRQA